MQETKTTKENRTSFSCDMGMEDKMSLEGFIYCIRHDVEQVLGRNVEVSLHQVTKNNGVKLDAITIRDVSCNIAPSIYLNELYKRYCQGMELEAVLQEVLHTYEEHKSESNFNMNFFMDWEQVKDRIIYKLVNYEKNYEMLKEIPYVKYLDLAIIFQVSVGSTDEGCATITIHDEHMSFWEKTTDDLYEMAMKNTPNLCKVQISSMADILRRMTGAPIPECFELDENVVPMYIMSNEHTVNGACTILYPNVLKEFANAKGKDLFVIPSSTHEVILVPTDSVHDMEYMSEMVSEVNVTQVAEDEVLSDHCYYFSRETGEISF